jgi:hypothetical protein
VKLTRRDWGSVFGIAASALTPLGLAAAGESTWLAAGISAAVAAASGVSAWLSQSPRRRT